MKKDNLLIKLLTIIIFMFSMILYEVGICKINNINFCRISLYLVFIIILYKNIDKFIPNVTKGIKWKKIIFIIFVISVIFLLTYSILKWNSIYKIVLVMIFALMGTLVITYISEDYIKNVIVIISTIGMLFSITTSFHHCLDEKKHSMSAINMAFGNISYSKNPLNEPAFNNIMFSCDINSYAKFFKEKYIPNLTNDWGNSKENEYYYICSSPADYNFILYIPSAIGIRLATILGGSIADVYIVGRIFNLIAYGIIVTIILKILPYKKKIFFIIYMLPIALLLSATYSIDGICIGIIGLFIAYCLKINENCEKIKLKQICILVLLFGLCLLAKNLAYFAVIFFILTLPIKKILKNNKKIVPILSFIIIGLILILTVLLINKANNMVINGKADVRGGETDGKGQIKFLLENPMNIVNVLFSHIMESLLNYDWYMQLNQTEFFGKYYKQIFFIELIFLIYVAITDSDRETTIRVKIVSILTFFAVFFSTSLMLYLNFTPIGMIGIKGYQTRYILPVLPIMLMIVSKNRKQCNNMLICTVLLMIIFMDLVGTICKI